MNWVGAKTPEAAVAIFQRNKIPTSIIYKFDEIEGVIFDHIWVEAFDGHNWRLMDPSFKTYVYTEGVGFDISEEAMAALADVVSENGNILSLDQEMLGTALQAQADKLTNTAGHLTVDEFLGKRKIFVTEKNKLPPYLARGIIGDRKPAEEFSEMPKDMRFKMKAVLPGGYEYITSIPEIAGKRVSVVYVSATAGDQAIIDYYGGIYNVPLPSLLVQMCPVLQIDGKTVATGTSIGLGLSNQSVQIGFLRPGTAGEWEFTNKPLTAGSRYNVFITTQKTALHELKRLSGEMINETIGLSEDDMATQDVIDNSLYASNMLYFGMVDIFSDYVSKSLNVIPVDHISMGYTCNEIKPVGFIGIIWGIARGGAHIDVVRSVKCPTSATGNGEDEVKWMQICGFVGTNTEHIMHEVAYEIDSVSTGKIFHEASVQGIPIHILDSAETLDANLMAISANSVVKNHIRTYVNEGYTAMIPQRGVTVGSWSGQGWIVMDEETGAAGYMICGGLHGETTMVNGGSLSKAIDNLYKTILKALKNIHKKADSLIIFYSAVIAAAVHLAAAIALCMMSSFFFIYYAIVSIGLIYAALFILNQLSNYVGYIRSKRRRYAFT